MGAAKTGGASLTREREMLRCEDNFSFCKSRTHETAIKDLAWSMQYVSKFVTTVRKEG